MADSKKLDTLTKEIIKCGSDVHYFINTYVKIQHPTRGLISFITYPYQDKCLDDFKNHRNNILLKARQLGMSTLTAAYVVWLALFQTDKNILIMATKQEIAMNILTKIKTTIANLPTWLVLPKVIEDNKHKLAFNNGSVIQAIARSDSAGRSEALSLLIVDEGAHIADFQKIWTGLKPTVSAGGNVIIISSPNGVGNQYHKLWVDADAGLNNFNPIKLPWNVHPEHDDQWFAEETKGQSDREINQEYLCSFLGSSDTFIQQNDLMWLKTLEKDPIERTGFDRNVWVWKHPVYTHKYILSADIARGDSKDYSSFHVIDCNESEIVCEYKGKIPPDRFGDLIFEFGNKYNKAVVCPEANTFGFMTITRLKDLGYPKLFKRESRDYDDFYSDKPEEKYGFNTQKQSRMLILNKLEELIRNRILKSYSSRLNQEFQTFNFVNTRAQALKGYNDDVIMSLAIGAWLFDAVFGFTKNSNKFDSTIINTMKVSQKGMSSVPLVNEVRPLSNISTFQYGKPKEVDEAMQRRFPHAADFSWLLK
jgi:hypothetical protein